VPWNINIDSLPEVWTCEMNSWDPEQANCLVPTDNYDPDRESTLLLNGEIVSVKSSDFKIGSWRDVFCERNRVYYQAVIKQKRVSKSIVDEFMLQFQFTDRPGMKTEWISGDSDRIHAHNLYTRENGLLASSDRVMSSTSCGNAIVKALKNKSTKKNKRC
jgi:hypothetical protein